MAPLARKHRKASPSPSPSEASSNSGSDSELHLDDHSDPEDSFFSTRSAADDDVQESSTSDEEEDDEESLHEEDDDDEESLHEEEDDGEMGELEQQYRTLQANQQSILQTLKQHRDDDVSRGQAIKNQKALWDKTLEMRFLLQKAFSTSNKLPKDPSKSRFCSHDQEIEQAYVNLLDSSKQTLGCMLELQKALLEQNQAAKGANDTLPDSNGESDEWLQVQKLHTRITPFRNTEIDKWQRKTQVTTGAAALKGKLHAFNQNISDQVAGYMRDPSRMIHRMYLRKSDVGVFGESAAEPATTVEGKDVEGDPELIDDSEFYHQLLKEFLESCDNGASESAFYALRKKQNKKRKLVDRRASKSRKIRYSVHEKIANFMAPVPMTVPPMASKLFENLFGMGNLQKSAAV
ncbi:protein BFR2-like [Triticum dicoccoides]|uniref:protein BFR2-like n=1 Tax=Triticum dicoccoides TaxID=85692 RepID=UPI00188E70B8|nr:protein BFR2-like [Triticum dicoccoides]